MNETFCILGNPNVGKTSLFNALTGSYEYIGIEWGNSRKKIGKLKGSLGSLIDLPGIYDLSPISKDETVVTDYLLTTISRAQSILLMLVNLREICNSLFN